MGMNFEEINFLCTC